MYIYSGGTATNVVWTPCVGDVYAHNGAYVTYASKYSGVYFGSDDQLLSHAASMSGKVVSDTMYIYSGGVASNTTVNSGDMYISSGGVANSTTVNSDGDMSIFSGGVANSTTVNSGGYMWIDSGGTATDITAQAGAWLGITVASDTYIQGTYNGSAFEMKDAFISGYTVNDYGMMEIGSGGVANSTTVNDYGWMYIYSGGVANSTTVNGGVMCIDSGGTATDITAQAGVRLDLTVASDTYIQGTYNGSAFEMRDAFISGYTVNWGNMYICSGGVANSTTVNWGNMYIFSGGVANSTTVNSDCYMEISSGGVANSTTVNSGGDIVIYSGGVANSTTVNWGDMYIFSGGVANRTTVNSGGKMYLSSGGVASSTTIKSAGNMYITNGGVANSTTVNSGGKMHLSRGGAADNTAVDRGEMHLSSGGVANSTTVNSGGYMYISSGGVANSTTVNSGGRMRISSGGVANSTTVDIGYMYISSGGVANSTTVNSGSYMAISSGGVANSTTVNSGSYMDIFSGGVANRTTVNYYGRMFISSGGVANRTTVNSGGYMGLDSGGVHRGSLNIKSGAVVSAYNGSVIDFTIADRTVKDGYLINDLSKITGTPTYTVTVDDVQAYGTYKLAQGAENFTGSVTIGNGEEEYGSVTANGNAVSYNNRAYSLTEKGGKLNLVVSNDKYIFISSKYNEKITGKIQDSALLEYGRNAFTSIDDVDYSGNKTIILLDSKNSGNYFNKGTIAGTVSEPVIKKTDNSSSYKLTATAKGTLNISQDTGSTEFIRFATVNVTGATVGNVIGGKVASNEEIKISVDKKGTVTDTEKTSSNLNANGKFTANEGSAATVKGYATINLTSATVTELSGGNTKNTTNSKLVDAAAKDQKTISTVNDSVAAGSVTLKNQAKADTISGYSNVTLTDSTVGDVTNFTSKDSQSDTFTFDEEKNTVTRKVALTHTESTAGTFKATDSTVGDVTGFATVNLKNVTSAGDFRRVGADGKAYSTVKESLNIKTDKKGVVTGSYTKTETFTRAGKFTAAGSTVGDIRNFSTVTLDGTSAEKISNSLTAKIVTKGTATWADAAGYGTPDDFDIDLSKFELTKTPAYSLNGSVTLKNGASAESITNFKSVTMTNSEVDGSITNVNKVTINKGDSTIGSYTGTDGNDTSYTGTDGNDTLSIAKGAVLTAGEIVLTDAKDTLALNGTLILSDSNFNVTKITGKGEIAAAATVWDDLDMDETVLNLGETSEYFRGTAYENADDSWKKAVKWDGKSEYNGWLGDWSGAKVGSDELDFIKFKATADTTLQITGDVNWLLLDKKGNEVDAITAAGDYIIQLNREEDKSTTYTIELA